MKKIKFKLLGIGSFTSKIELINKELDQTVVKFKNKKGGYKILKRPIYYRGIVLCLLVLLMFTFITAGCKEPTTLNSSQSGNSILQTDDKDKKDCDIDNPLTDLVWLKQIVDNIEIDAKNGKVHARIYQCTYKYGTGFLIEPCVGCPDAGYSFRSCDGTILCGSGGISGEDTCQELDIDLDTKQLIYQHN